MCLSFLEGVKRRTVRTGIHVPIVGPENTGEINRDEPATVLALTHRNL